MNARSQGGQPLPHHIALIQQPKQAQTLKQQQRLIMSDHMQQALNILQKPIQELAELIQVEMEANPILEYTLAEEEDDWTLEGEREEPDLDKDHTPEQELEFNDKDFEALREMDEEFRDLFNDSQNYSLRHSSIEQDLKDYQDHLVIGHKTLYEYLVDQARQILTDSEELKIAELIIGNLDESGFLGVSLSEISLLSKFQIDAIQKVLIKLQEFEPHGICARNLRECLLIQLRIKGKEDTLAFRIVSDFYDELIHNRIPAIQKRLGSETEQLNQAIYHDIGHLDFHPGNGFSQQPVRVIIPDLIIDEENEEFKIRVQNEDYMPRFRFNGHYLKLLSDEETPKATKDFIKQKLLSAKWMLRNIHHRGSTLENIGRSLIQYQKDFFSNPLGRLNPLTMKSLAEELDVHESTIARAVANKYIDTPRGIFPLRFFFSAGMIASNGEDISNKTIQGLVKQIIEEEDKMRPLTDELIVKKLEEKGVDCARRTVAKYRGVLGIGNTHQRKHHC